MAELSDIRVAMGVALSTIPTLRVREFIPPLILPPMAVVNPSNIEYDLNAQRGLTRFSMTVSVFVVKADDRSAQKAIDPFVGVSGALSVKAALEADRTLGGVVDTCRVQSVSNYSAQDANDVNYLAVDFEVEVFA